METLQHLVDKWPSSIVARRCVKQFSGGILSEKYLANLDSAGLGPPRIHIGRQVAYRTCDLVQWLERRTSKGGDCQS
jgi:hypothetical protein